MKEELTGPVGFSYEIRFLGKRVELIIEADNDMDRDDFIDALDTLLESFLNDMTPVQ